jgi:excisionase family DNA binding protein
VKLTLGEAAKQTGISKSHLSRLVKRGVISAERHENGRLAIDPAELDRLADIRTSGNTLDNVAMERKETLLETARQQEIALLHRMLLDRERQIEDLRQERDEWRRQAQTLLLTQGHNKEPEKPRRWWMLRRKAAP